MAPTEEDNFFRQDLIQDVVHDPMAAFYGGVAGNAGLFSNANDLAVVLQMNLQNGYYGDKRHLQEGVVQAFVKKSFKDNRRGLGWDKPDKHNAPPTASAHASADSYGHSGFTGTAVWVDPQYDLIYVFLSNRAYPDVTNNRLSKKKGRCEDPRRGVRGHYGPVRRYIKSCYATNAIVQLFHHQMVNARMHKPRNTYF